MVKLLYGEFNQWMNWALRHQETRLTVCRKESRVLIHIATWLWIYHMPRKGEARWRGNVLFFHRLNPILVISKSFYNLIVKCKWSKIGKVSKVVFLLFFLTNIVYEQIQTALVSESSLCLTTQGFFHNAQLKMYGVATKNKSGVFKMFYRFFLKTCSSKK